MLLTLLAHLPSLTNRLINNEMQKGRFSHSEIALPAFGKIEIYPVFNSVNRNFGTSPPTIGCTSEIKKNQFFFVFRSVCTNFGTFPPKIGGTLTIKINLHLFCIVFGLH